jgi:hypothetical protein
MKSPQTRICGQLCVHRLGLSCYRLFEEKPPERLDVLGLLDLTEGAEPSFFRTEEDDDDEDDDDGLVVKLPVLPELEGVAAADPELLFELELSVLLLELELLVLPLELKLPVRSVVPGLLTSDPLDWDCTAVPFPEEP